MAHFRSSPPYIISQGAVFQGCEKLLDSAGESEYHFHCRGRTVRPLPHREVNMAWKSPKIREICIGMEINAYMPSEL